MTLTHCNFFEQFYFLKLVILPNENSTLITIKGTSNGSTYIFIDFLARIENKLQNHMLCRNKQNYILFRIGGLILQQSH